MNTQVFHDIGWVLMHSLWQFAVIGLLAWICLQLFTHRKYASVRYNILLVAMTLMIVCPPVTMTLVMESSPVASTASEDGGQMLSTDGPAISLPSIPGPDPTEIPGVAATDPPETSSTASGEAAGIGHSKQVSPASLVNVIADTVEPWLEMIVAVWCLGVLFFASRLALGWCRIRSLKNRSTDVDDDAILSILRRAAEKLNIRRKLRLMVSHSIDSPVVFGVLRSTILVPTSFLSGISPDVMEAIFAHELAHVRRYDYAVNLLQSVVESLFFYHPGVWWLSGRLRDERETCCDDLAVAAMRNPVTVSRALLAIEELRSRNLSPALSAAGGSLLTRVRRLLGAQQDCHGSVRTASVITVGLLVSLLAGVAGLAIVKAEAAEENEDPDSHFTAVFDEGHSVEFMAVKPHQSNVSTAWRPNGAAFEQVQGLPDVPYNSTTKKLEGLDLFFQFEGLTETQLPVYDGEGLHTMWNPNDEGFATVILVPTDDAATTRITVGIPDAQWGPWQPVDKNGALTERVLFEPQYREAYASFKIHDIQSRSESVLVRWAHDRESEDLARLELVAVTKEGNRLRPDGATLWDDDEGKTRSADVFRTSIDTIDHYEYRLCPIRYRVTFDNVSLQRGQKTKTNVKVDHVPVPSADKTFMPEILLPESSSPRNIRFAGDSTVVSVAYGEGLSREGHYPRIRTWDLRTKEMTSEVPLQWEKEWTRYTDQLVLAEDLGLVCGSLGNELGVWDAETGQLLRRMKPAWEEFGDLTLRHVVATPTGDRVACSGLSNSTVMFQHGHIYVWDARTGEMVREIKSDRTGYVRSFALSDNGQYVAAWPAKGGVGIWDIESGKQVFEFKNENPPGSWPGEPMTPSVPDQVLGLQFSHDGKTLAIGDLVGVKLIDIRTGDVKQSVRAPLRYGSPNFVFSPDDRLLLRCGVHLENRQESLLWDVETGEQIATLPIEGSAAAFSPDGDQFAIGRSDPKQAIAVWNLQLDGNPSNRPGPDDQVDDQQKSGSEGDTGHDSEGVDQPTAAVTKDIGR